MRFEYPGDPHFAPLAGRADAPNNWGAFGAHDPSLIFAEGAYYAFSTGTFGEKCYQIRRSPDLIHWEYAGQAFPAGIAASLAPVLRAVECVYGKGTENDTLWAPDIVPAHGGGYWLYGCYTAAFGKNYSAIFLASAQNIEGPYAYADTLVLTGGDWGLQPNAIDAQIFYDGEGRMFMTYGSFYGGIRILELDPRTGRRKDGLTYRDFAARKVGREAYFGRHILRSSNAEGSVVAYKRSVPVYRGDIFAGAEDARLWSRTDRYYLMCSADSLSQDYNMRVWSSEFPDRGYTAPPCGFAGQKAAGSFSWRRGAEDLRIGFDFFVPGHNDLFTAPNGVEVAAYHCRTPYSDRREPRAHYLFVSLCAYNSKGELLLSPNRYAGERLRKIEREELSGKTFDYVQIGSGNFDCAYAKSGICLEGDGSLMLCGEKLGEWKLYGDNFVAFTFDGMRYFGAAMPAWIEAEARGGITISARGEDGLPFFLNRAF